MVFNRGFISFVRYIVYFKYIIYQKRLEKSGFLLNLISELPKMSFLYCVEDDPIQNAPCLYSISIVFWNGCDI
jgi:hypothetical protein